MSMFGRNWLDEGYYEEDSYGDLNRIEDKEQILEAQKKGNLYKNDGFSTDHVDIYDLLNLDKKRKYE